LQKSVRPWSNAEIEAEFDSAIAPAAFDSPEVAVDPVTLAANPVQMHQAIQSPLALARRQTLKCLQAFWNNMEGLFVDSKDRHLRRAK